MQQFENKTFEQVWTALGDVPVNEDMELDEPFLNYPVGTDCMEIWHDLEDHFDLSIGDYLYLNKQKS